MFLANRKKWAIGTGTSEPCAIGFYKNASYLTDIYFLKVNNGNIVLICEMFSKLTIMPPERRH